MSGLECVLAGQRLSRRVRLGFGTAAAGVAVILSGCSAPALGVGTGGIPGSHPGAGSAGGKGGIVDGAGGAPGHGTRQAGIAGRPLAGLVVGIDPGHNGGNSTHQAIIDRQIWNGRAWENCNTTGTATDDGYTEAQFNFQVAVDLRADLTAAGARVVMTRAANNGVGPCVNQRAAIMNDAHVNAAIAIHADGGPPDGRGFAILEPIADGANNAVIGPSGLLGADIRAALLARTAMPPSNYDGVNGLKARDDLAGLNLTQVPTVLIEVGNMRNATDASLLISAPFQQQVARTLTTAIISFLQ
jgi:N-acetylmuramoyl-L-alanine amidase